MTAKGAMSELRRAVGTARAAVVEMEARIADAEILLAQEGAPRGRVPELVHQLIGIYCATCGIHPEAMVGRRRHYPLALHRIVLCAALRSALRLSTYTLSTVFQRDITTINLHSHRARDIVSTEPEFRAVLAEFLVQAQKLIPTLPGDPLAFLGIHPQSGSSTACGSRKVGTGTLLPQTVGIDGRPGNAGRMPSPSLDALTTKGASSPASPPAAPAAKSGEPRSTKPTQLSASV